MFNHNIHRIRSDKTQVDKINRWKWKKVFH